VNRAARWAGIGAIAAGLVGAVAGLIVGLDVHPATAWFAAFELGFPAAVLGALVGCAAGAIAAALRRTDLEVPPPG